MIKRITAGFIAACISASFALSVNAEEGKKYFTIEQAIEYAKENNLDLISKRESEEYERLNCEAVRLATKNYRKSDMGVSSISTYLLSGGYNHEATKVSYRVARRNTIKTENNLESTVKQAFYKCVNQKKKLELANDSLKSANDRKTYAEVRFNTGMISALDMTSFELAVLKAQNDLNAQERTLNSYLLNLKTVMNYPTDEEIDVTGEFKRVEMDTTPLAEAKALMANSIDKANVDDSFYIAEKKYKCYTAYYTSNLYEYQAAKYEYAAAQANYQNNLNSLEKGLFEAYNAMMSAYEGLEYLDKTLAYTEAQAQAAKLRYEMGMISADDYNSIVQSYESTRNSVADTELNAYMANEAYRGMFATQNTVKE